MVKEYLKLARSYNAVLTGIPPVMGAIAMQQYDPLHLYTPVSSRFSGTYIWIYS